MRVRACGGALPPLDQLPSLPPKSPSPTVARGGSRLHPGWFGASASAACASSSARLPPPARLPRICRCLRTGGGYPMAAVAPSAAIGPAPSSDTGQSTALPAGSRHRARAARAATPMRPHLPHLPKACVACVCGVGCQALWGGLALTFVRSTFLHFCWSTPRRRVDTPPHPHTRTRTRTRTPHHHPSAHSPVSIHHTSP